MKRLLALIPPHFQTTMNLSTSPNISIIQIMDGLTQITCLNIKKKEERGQSNQPKARNRERKKERERERERIQTKKVEESKKEERARA